ncbi:MAG: hypothetical protein Q9196_005205 [Gyalolechia fulgens]
MADHASFPADGTWFDTLKKSFVDVPVDTSNNNAIPTADFLEAAESLTTLFDLLGSIAFTPVKNDMLGNVKVSPSHPAPLPQTKNPQTDPSQKVRDRLLSSPSDSSTIQSLVRTELAQKKHSATEGLLWLVRYLPPLVPFSPPRINTAHRGLDFTSQALRHSRATPTAELSTSFRTAYTSTLKPHHSFLVKPVFSAAMSATPYKKDFYAKMAGSGDEERAKAELGRWLDALEGQVGVLKGFMEKEGRW